jgi:hypothetical protein
MNQGAQGYSLTKKNEGRKSRETVPLILNENNLRIRATREGDIRCRLCTNILYVLSVQAPSIKLLSLVIG